MVTKEEFRKFVDLQRTGRKNMLSKEVQDICEISEEQHLYIMKNYVDLCRKYNISFY